MASSVIEVVITVVLLLLAHTCHSKGPEDRLEGETGTERDNAVVIQNEIERAFAKKRYLYFCKYANSSLLESYLNKAPEYIQAYRAFYQHKVVGSVPRKTNRGPFLKTKPEVSWFLVS